MTLLSQTLRYSLGLPRILLQTSSYVLIIVFKQDPVKLELGQRQSSRIHHDSLWDLLILVIFLLQSRMAAILTCHCPSR
jgi:hypothetical protein